VILREIEMVRKMEMARKMRDGERGRRRLQRERR
jgi:hypothetical protein